MLRLQRGEPVVWIAAGLLLEELPDPTVALLTGSGFKTPPQPAAL